MEIFDVGVIGGGITGASAANHLVAAGYSTLLLDQGDFGGATTGRTSRLQYSGLSYLDSCRSLGRIARRPRGAIEGVQLARRAMRDRSAFVRDVPERVRPVTFYLPIYRGGPISLRMMRWGLQLMERLDPGGVPLKIDVIEPEVLRREACLRHLRDLDRLEGVVSCVEYQFDWPERICVDAIFNARENGARVENYTCVERIERRSDGSWLLHVHDRTRNERRIHAVRTVMNAAGAWVDEIAQGSSLGMPRLNQGAKGSNVMVRLPEEFRGLGFESLTRSGEPFYVIPWGGLHYFGPANRAQDPSEDGFKVGADEITYLLDEFNHLFPRLRLGRSDVIYHWAGVRPRTADPHHPVGGPAVRLHDLSDQGAPGYFAYTGGLLMVHRSAGRDMVKGIGRRVTPSGKSRPLIGSARTVPSQADELLYACEQEQVVELDDLLRRRVRSGWGEQLGCDIAHEVAASVRDVMGWTQADASARADRYIRDTRSVFGLAE